MFPAYADNSVCDWRAGVSVALTITLGVTIWAACAYIGAAIDYLTGQMVFTIFFAFGVPILGVVGNGWRSQ